MSWGQLMIAGATTLLVTLTSVIAIPSRFIRGRLRFSAYLLLIFLFLELLISQSIGQTELVSSVARLFFVLALVNIVVVLVVNPWRTHQASDRIPAIVQDVAVIVLFILIATVLMQEKLLTTSAVGAVVVGFALQDTLGNLFAGLAIQAEKPFRVGQWIRVGAKDGQVMEITWRATKLCTVAGEFLIVPNGLIGKDAVINYSEPTVATRLEVVVGVGYQFPPNVVKAAIGEALSHAPLVLQDPPPAVLVDNFGDSAVIYKVYFWIYDYGKHELASDQVRSGIWYTFQRKNIEIPYPIQVEIGREDCPARPPEAIAAAADRLARVELFASLTADERLVLAHECPEKMYANEQRIVRQGDAGSSMFVIVSGRVLVILEPSGQEVAQIETGGFFGEMSMLTGEARAASVRADGDATVLEITTERFRALALARSGLVEEIANSVDVRRAGLYEARAAAAAATNVLPLSRRSLLERIQGYLRLT
jgi:small-conductance mechanosensitive channel/CRP-like cAMP-binding protein